MIKLFSPLSRRLRNRKGFTIIELLVVVVIIALLVAIATPLYVDARQRARQTAHDANAKILKGAAVMFIMENPSTAAIWAPFANQKATEVAGSLAPHDQWAKYVEVFPENPLVNDGSYVVEINEDGGFTVSPDVGAYE